MQAAELMTYFFGSLENYAFEHVAGTISRNVAKDFEILGIVGNVKYPEKKVFKVNTEGKKCNFSSRIISTPITTIVKTIVFFLQYDPTKEGINIKKNERKNKNMYIVLH